MANAIVAAALALIGFVVTQSLLKFVIEPIQDQRKLIGEIAHALTFYANVHVDALYAMWELPFPESEREDNRSAEETS